MNTSIYIARHASPDWTRTDLRYDIPPGPPLTSKGEQEARMLGDYLKGVGISRFYSSPLDRAYRTALLAAEATGLDPLVDEALAEWRREDTAESVAARLYPFWQRACEESRLEAPVCLVTHGGPLGLLLYHLGLPADVIEHHRSQYDNQNVAPPAGLWHANRAQAGSRWQIEFVFQP